MSPGTGSVLGIHIKVEGGDQGHEAAFQPLCESRDTLARTHTNHTHNDSKITCKKKSPLNANPLKSHISKPTIPLQRLVEYTIIPKSEKGAGRHPEKSLP